MEEDELPELTPEQQAREEAKQYRILLEEGFTFKVDKKSLLRHLGKNKERTFHIRPPYLSTLDRLSAIYLDLDFKPEIFAEDPNDSDDVRSQKQIFAYEEAKRMVARNAKRVAYVIAVAYLNSGWKTKIFGKLLAWYFGERISSFKLPGIISTISVIQNSMGFTSSIGLIAAQRRTASPVPIEAKQPD